MHRSLRVGITGKMGSGKSTLSKIFRESGITVLESDAIAKEIMTLDPEAKSLILQLLGRESYEDGTLNRPFIANKIFSDVKLREELEAIVHPRVTTRMRAAFDLEKPGVPIALESALILQTELWREVDYIILVDATDESIIERLTIAGKFSTEDIRARLREQSRTTIDRDEADFIIANNGSLAQFSDRAALFLTILPTLGQRDLPELPLHQLELKEDEETPSLN